MVRAKVLLVAFALVGVVVLGTGSNPATAWGADPTLVLNPTPATPGTTVEVAIDDWPSACNSTPGAVSYIQLNGSPTGHANVNGQVDFGSVTGTLTLPLNLAPATYTVTFECDTSVGNGIARSASLVVQAGAATGPARLRAVTSPAVPGEITVDGVARDTWGINWAKFSTGTHQVCFGPVPGFTQPPCQINNLTPGATTTFTGTYAAKGYLRVITSPAVPSTITVNGTARNDWGLWTEIAPGTYTVCFGAVAGFNVPGCRDVTVAAGATATTTGVFAANAAASGPSGPFGYLRATTSPAVNAMISVDGIARNNWGLDWMKVATGSHQVCFGPAQNMTAPAACPTVNVANGATTTVSGTYVPKGFVRVTTSPAVPANIYLDGQVANAYGVWTAVEPGPHTVCFGPVPDRVTPACNLGFNVAGGLTTTINGSYQLQP